MDLLDLFIGGSIAVFIIAILSHFWRKYIVFRTLLVVIVALAIIIFVVGSIIYARFIM